MKPLLLLPALMLAAFMAQAQPVITAPPTNQTLATGSTLNLSVTVDNAAPPYGYQWFKDGRFLISATNSAYAVTNADVTSSGIYYVAVTNAGGMTITVPVLVAVGNPDVLMWGQRGPSSTAPFVLTSNAVTAAVGSAYALLITNDGTLWAVGFNNAGQFGNGTTNTSYAFNPVKVGSNIAALAAGSSHSLRVDSSGELWTAGYNNHGQLGNSTTNDSSSPVLVTNNVVAVAAGIDFSLFVKDDGTLWAMGDNQNGQLGDGMTNDAWSPAFVASNVVAVAAGQSHSLFMKNDGTLWAMGLNIDGQLGNGTFVSTNLPINVATNVAAISAGLEHSLFVQNDGTLWAMGYNLLGELGMGPLYETNRPVNVTNNVKAMAAGAEDSLFIKNDGTLWAMGTDEDGQLGINTSTNVPTMVPYMSLARIFCGVDATTTMGIGQPQPPVILQQPASQTLVAGNPAAFTVMAAGFSVTTNYQWYFNGTNISGATSTNYIIPFVQTNNSGNYTVVVTNAFGSVTSSVAVLSVGSLPTVSLSRANNQSVTVGGTVSLTASVAGTAPVCQWVKDGRILLGATNTALTITNAGVAASGIYCLTATNAYGMVVGIPTRVGVGNPHLLGWGNDIYSQLGNNTYTNNVRYAVPVVSNVVAATAGYDSLFIKADGTLWGMGDNNQGQLGLGSEDPTQPTLVVSNVITVAAGYWHSLYADKNEMLWAMGSDIWGQLGNGKTNLQSYTSPLNITTNTVAVAAGQYHSLFIRTDGTLWGMGWNGHGQLGNGTNVDAHSPIDIASNVLAVAAGGAHSLFVKADGSLWAMGLDFHGELGNHNTNDCLVPVNVTNNVTCAAAGIAHSVFVTADGTLWAMGWNAYGQLGNGTTNDSLVPIVVATNVLAAAAGDDFSVFLKNDGTVWAMGDNQYGQLGNGTTNSSTLPVQVNGLSLANVVSGSSAFHSLAIGLPEAPYSFAASPGGQLQLNGAPLYPYTLLSATNLTPPVAWQPVVTNLTDTNGNWSFTDFSASNSPAKFYRATAQ